MASECNTDALALRQSSVVSIRLASQLTQHGRCFVFRETLKQSIWDQVSCNVTQLETLKWLKANCTHNTAVINITFPYFEPKDYDAMFETVWFALSDKHEAMLFKLVFDNIIQVNKTRYDRIACRYQNTFTLG
jgi:hypothetical protein